MAFLRSIEHRIEGLLEGLFGRAFRTNVQPVELARKLAKEMDEHRSASVSRVYVPNEYTLYLSPDDRAQFADYESSLVDELAEHLSEHARREAYALLTPPQVLLETDEDLAVGEFGIATRMAQPQPAPGRRSAPVVSGPGDTMIYKQQEPDRTEAASAAELGFAADPTAFLTADGERYTIDKRRIVIGRSKDCDIQLDDPNVSRRHAELRREGEAVWLIDLGSTNGTDVNGRRRHRARLADGDKLVMGTTELVFRQEQP